MQNQHKRVIEIVPGKTIPEVFFGKCTEMGNAVATVDRDLGVLTYNELKKEVIWLTHAIEKLPGDVIGVLLPAGALAYCVVMAIQLAGKRR